MPKKVLNEHLSSFVLTLRIIVASLVQGLLVFLAVAVYQRLVAPEVGLAVVFDPLTIVSIVVAFAALIAQPLVAGLIVSRGRQRIADGTWKPPGGQTVADSYIDKGDTGRLMAVYQLRTIVSCAILEGAAFLAAVVVLLEGSLICLGIAVGLMISVACRFPFQNLVAAWIEEQLRLIDDERGFEQ